MKNKKFLILLTTLLAILTLFITPTEALAVVKNINGQTGDTQTFQNDTNITISSSNNIHSLIWQGFLPVSRGGTGVGSFIAGSLPFFNGSTFAENNSKLFWDNTNNRLGIGTSSPTSTLDVSGNAKVTSLTSTADSTINSINVGLGGGSVANNTAFGKDALISASGGANTAIGFRALANTGSYTDVTAVGTEVLSNNTGSGNVAIGSSAMKENVTGEGNVAVGTAAMGLDNSGSLNVALGGLALRNNASGNSNIAIGSLAAQYQATGFTELTSPENSIYIGSGTRGFDNNDSNSIVLGYNAIGAGANTAVIGNSGLGHVYFGSAAGQAVIHARKMFLGSSTTPGCIIMGDSDASGVSYLTVNDGILSVSTTQPSSCSD